MTPANLLPVKPGDRVLDICAAPGGKSTELGARLRGEGLLFSNDISNSRAKALLKNLEMAGIPNICVSSEAPEKLSEFLPEFFDCILVDAPCSGEGMFRREPDMIKSYRERGPEDYVPIQRAIMEEAVKMLRPGGYLLYSTCTFDREENEGTIRYILDRHPDMSLCSLPHRFGFAEGIGMPECVRLFPHRIEGRDILRLSFGGPAPGSVPGGKTGQRSQGLL
ncbi:nOL1/NOP2/sun family [Clostridium sp. CAG:149]|nr:nOL1/NOP2/sun family [Clostridium sp. CAG:149]